MVLQTSTSTPRSIDRANGLAAPVLTWIAIQLLALLLPALRIPIGARLPPMESMSLPLMIAMQVAASAMLFPWLMREPRAALFVVLLSAPFIQLAGLLGDDAASNVFVSMVQMILWISAMGFWRASLRQRRWEMLGVVLASAIAIGGGSVFYFVVEFGGADSTLPPVVVWIALLTNLICSVALLTIVHKRK